MSNRIKIVLLVSIVVIAIIAIHSVFTLILIPNMQKEKAIKGFSDNVEKFEDVHNYIAKKYPFSRFIKEGSKVKIYSTDFNKSEGNMNTEVEINDSHILQQINYILNNLDFSYIENIQDDTHFVFRDEKGHFQSIDYTTYDIFKIKGWKIIKLKDNWYYRSIWTYFLKYKEETDFSYRLRVIYHIVRGY